MIAPEVCNFPAPPCSFQFLSGDFSQTPDKVLCCISNHHYNHAVTVVLPNLVLVPQSITDSMSEDCSYYQISNLPVSELVQPDFIEAFVKQGASFALSVSTCLDTDNCCCLTPSGHLVLSLTKIMFEELGLQGKASFFCRSNPPSRYVVTIDLKAKSFVPGKKNYERVKICLSKRLKSTFKILIAWEPPDDKVCPSSIAAYFDKRGYCVTLCDPKLVQRRDTQVPVPILEETSPEEMLEWLGALSLRCELNPGSDNFISTFFHPPNIIDEKLQVAYMQWSGFFTTLQVKRLLDILRRFLKDKETIPWAAIHVQGFDDSPIAWALQEHSYFQTGDNFYTLFIENSDRFLLCRALGSQRKPYTKSKIKKRTQC